MAPFYGKSLIFPKFPYKGAICCNNFSVIWPRIKYESRYLLEIFNICLSHVCANLTKKFWPLLNQPASHSPFRPKLWTSLATVFVDIFWKEKNWVGFRPFPMTHWKEFLISWKKRRFEIFWSSWKSILTLSTANTTYRFFVNLPTFLIWMKKAKVLFA